MVRTLDLWTAKCCRLWPVMPYYGSMGRCGICNERPEIIYLYWDDEKGASDMAQGKREVKTETIEKVVTEEREVATITLTLTQEEADLLRSILGHISGGGSFTSGPKTRERRDTLDGIWTALYKNGAQNIGNPFEESPNLRDIDTEVPF